LPDIEAWLSFLSVSLALAEHVPFATVHNTVVVVLTGTPVALAVVGEVGLLIVTPVQLRLHVQLPLPNGGVVANKLKLPLLHCAWVGLVTTGEG
jgi:hypothetical protein